MTRTWANGLGSSTAGGGINHSRDTSADCLGMESGDGADRVASSGLEMIICCNSAQLDLNRIWRVKPLYQGLRGWDHPPALADPRVLILLREILIKIMTLQNNKVVNSVLHDKVNLMLRHCLASPPSTLNNWTCSYSLISLKFQPVGTSISN